MSAGAFPRDAARTHIEYLAARNGIKVYEINRMWDSEADIKLRTIYVADPITPLRYMVALHEIGHIVDKVSAGVVGKGRDYHAPACEAAAWSWAYDHADPELMKYVTPRMWRRIGRAWVTSLGKAARSAHPTQ
jgi:hypothetical protein